MNYPKKAFSLFELLLVLFLSSIVITYSFIFTKKIYEWEIINTQLAILKLDLNCAKIIIGKNLKKINKLYLQDETLYLDGNILLEKINSFSKKINNNIVHIDVTIDKKISQTWKFKL